MLTDFRELKWEYKIIKNYETMEERDLNRLGLLGWELVIVGGNQHYFKFIFKRVKDVAKE